MQVGAGEREAETSFNPMDEGPVSMGTVLGAIKCSDGIICVSDSRTSTSSMISNDFTDKIQVIDEDGIVSMQAGNAAASQFLVNQARTSALFHKRRFGRTIPVVALANLIAQYLYKYQGILESAMIIAGYESQKGFQTYMLRGGMVTELNCVTMGSGSPYITENLSKVFDPSKTVEQTLPACKELILQAIDADPSCGGVVNVRIVRKGKIEKCSDFDAKARVDYSLATASTV